MKREILFKAKSVDTGEWIESMTIEMGTIESTKNKLFMDTDNDYIDDFEIIGNIADLIK